MRFCSCYRKKINDCTFLQEAVQKGYQIEWQASLRSLTLFIDDSVKIDIAYLGSRSTKSVFVLMSIMNRQSAAAPDGCFQLDT